jgi:hypothetical protein
VVATGTLSAPKGATIRAADVWTTSTTDLQETVTTSTPTFINTAGLVLSPPGGGQTAFSISETIVINDAAVSYPRTMTFNVFTPFDADAETWYEIQPQSWRSDNWQNSHS